MAFKPQNADGTVEHANAYVSVAEMKAYWDDRGIDLSAKTDTELEVSIVKATDFLDSRYTWVGYQRHRLQGTQWPRGGLPSSFLRGLPLALKNACCLMAQRALAGKPLMPDPTFDPSGQKVTGSTKKVGPIEVSLTFAEAVSGSPGASVPAYPEVDLMLKAAGLVMSGGSGVLVRG